MLFPPSCADMVRAMPGTARLRSASEQRRPPPHRSPARSRSVRLASALRRFGLLRRARVERLEGVTVSVDYADYLSQVLPHNKAVLDRILVVTSPDDRATQEACRASSVECIVTDDFYAGGARFNKGRGLNRGLERTAPDAWVLVLDADIVLPQDLRERLAARPLRTNVLYGASRVSCPTAGTWRRLERGEIGVRDLPAEPPTVRHGRLLPLGYFQLFHRGAATLRGRTSRYPEAHPSARKVDTAFAKRWRRTELLPVTVIHLGPPATDWDGRVSPAFE